MTNTLDEDRAVDPPLAKLLSELPDDPAPAGWEDRVRDALRTAPPPRKRSRIVAYAAAATAVCAAAAFVICSPLVLHGHGYKRIEVAKRSPSGTRSANAKFATIRDELVVTINDATKVRVYQDGILVMDCPGDPACRAEAFTVTKLSGGLMTVVGFYGNTLQTTRHLAEDLANAEDDSPPPDILDINVR